MATESLIVELDARTSKIDAKLKETERRLDGVEGSVKSTDKAFLNMAKGATIAATAAATAISALAISANNYAREIEVAAARTGTTVEEMQALAFASETVGISLEKLGDIGKDTNEKIGEFLATGGGGFQDFVDVLKLNTTEARELALELQQLSGTDVLKELVSQLEAAGVSSNQVSFALEGLASDATDLIPLLSDNASELNRLTNEFDKLGVTLSQEQITRIRQVGEEFSKLGSTLSAEGRQLVADYSDELIAAINAIETLAVKTIDAFNLISVGWGNLVDISSAAISDLINGTDTLAGVIEERTQRSQEAINELLGVSDGALEIIITGGTEAVKRATKEEGASLDQRTKNFKNYISAANQINNAFLEENKAIKAGLIVADTAAAVMLQLSSGDPYTAFSRAALAAAVGAAQLSNALSATKGGGTISEGTVSAPSTVDTGQQDFQPETTDLQLTDATASGSQVLNITVPEGDEIGMAIANWLTTAQQEGRV